MFRRNLDILEANFWDAAQSEVFRIAWHRQRLRPIGRSFDVEQSETDSGSVRFSVLCLSNQTRSTKIFRAAIQKMKAMLKRKT